MTSLLANAGTPFIWGSFCVLAFGNVAIGLFEAHILRRRYGIENPHLGLWIVLANYFTAFVGYVAVPAWLGIWESLAELVRFYFEIAVVVLAWFATYLATAIMEWWVVHRSAEGKLSPWKALRASLWINFCSYACLAPFAVYLSDWSGPLNLKSRTVTLKMDRKLPKGFVLFVTPDGKRIEKISFDHKNRKRIQSGLNLKPHRSTALVMAISPTGRKHLKYTDYSISEDSTMILDFDPGGRTEYSDLLSGWNFPRVGAGFGRSFDRGEGEFGVTNMGWLGDDFKVRNRSTDQSYSLSFETPFLHWSWSNQTVIPDGWCVAEMDGGIYLIDLRNKQIGLIAKGFGSMVVLDN